MTEDGHIVTVLHGARDAAERDAVMDGFRFGKTKVLITTNVLARGIDVNQVNMVINYDLPVDQRGSPDFETYLHRIGRTGRFGRTGVSIAFIHDQKSWKELDAFQKYFGVEMVKIPTKDWEETENMIKAGMLVRAQSDLQLSRRNNSSRVEIVSIDNQSESSSAFRKHLTKAIATFHLLRSYLIDISSPTSLPRRLYYRLFF
jgi:superfamily II DNA/RNA helicase